MMVYCVRAEFKSDPLYSEGAGSVNPCKRCWKPEASQGRANVRVNSEEYVPSESEGSSDEDVSASSKKSRESGHPLVMPSWSSMSAAGIFDALALCRLAKGKPTWVTEIKPAWGNVVNRVIKAMALPESFGKILATTVKERSLQRKVFEGFDKPEHLSKLLALRKILENETKPAPPQPPAATREGDDVDNLICRLAMMCVEPRCQQLLGLIYTGPGEDNGR
jgi:hypothetical protein